MSALSASTAQRRPVLLLGLAAATAIALVAALVIQATAAAWSTSTTNGSNSWGTATIGLSQSPTAVMFEATGMVPGGQETATITIANTGSAELAVKLYGASLTDTDLLAQYLDLVITVDSVAVYTGTVKDFAGTKTDYATGTATKTLAKSGATGDSYTLSFSVTLNSATPDTFQNKSASVNFVWEGRTTA